jgi:hypothetical protein
MSKKSKVDADDGKRKKILEISDFEKKFLLRSAFSIPLLFLLVLHSVFFFK